MTAVKDPVCGMMVEPERAAGKFEFKGTTYYFCAKHCEQRFAAEYAVSRVIRRYAKTLESLEGDFVAGRVNDLFDIERFVVTLGVLAPAVNVRTDQSLRFSLGLTRERDLGEEHAGGQGRGQSSEELAAGLIRARAGSGFAHARH